MKTNHDFLNPQYNEEDGVYRALEAIEQLIRTEVDAGMPENRIVLAGFSMGGAVAIQTALESRRKFAGVMVFSTWMPLFNRTEEVSCSAPR